MPRHSGGWWPRSLPPARACPRARRTVAISPIWRPHSASAPRASPPTRRFAAPSGSRTIPTCARCWSRWWRRGGDDLDGSPATRRRRVAAVRAFCRWWSRVCDMENPVSELRPPGAAGGSRHTGREVVAFAQSDMRRLLEAAQRSGPVGARDVALIEILYGCGLRASEAVGLNVSACNLDDGEDPYLVVTGKGARVRAVAVPQGARVALQASLRIGRPELVARRRDAG